MSSVWRFSAPSQFLTWPRKPEEKDAPRAASYRQQSAHSGADSVTVSPTFGKYRAQPFKLCQVQSLL